MLIIYNKSCAVEKDHMSQGENYNPYNTWIKYFCSTEVKSWYSSFWSGRTGSEMECGWAVNMCCYWVFSLICSTLGSPDYFSARDKPSHIYDGLTISLLQKTAAHSKVQFSLRIWVVPFSLLCSVFCYFNFAKRHILLVWSRCNYGLHIYV